MGDDELTVPDFSEPCVPFTGSVATADACSVDAGELSVGLGVNLACIEALAAEESSFVAHVGFMILERSKHWIVLLFTGHFSRPSSNAPKEAVSELESASGVVATASTTVLEMVWIMLFSMISASG